MLPELKDFAAEIKKEKIHAENQLLAVQIAEKLIQESDGGNWVSLLNIPPAPKVYLCRSETGVFEKGFIYFAAEWTHSMGFREIGESCGEGIFEYINWDEIKVLI